jgi:hypothetical protein
LTVRDGWPRSRNRWARRANSAAACSVKVWRVSPGFSCSGSVKAHLSQRSFRESASSSSPIS